MPLINQQGSIRRTQTVGLYPTYIIDKPSYSLNCELGIFWIQIQQEAECMWHLQNTSVICAVPGYYLSWIGDWTWSIVTTCKHRSPYRRYSCSTWTGDCAAKVILPPDVSILSLGEVWMRRGCFVLWELQSWWNRGHRRLRWLALKWSLLISQWKWYQQVNHAEPAPSLRRHLYWEVYKT